MLAANRYSTTGVSARKSGVVIHDSESGDRSAGSLLAHLAIPGTRPIEGSNPPRFYGSGYHAITLNVDAAYEMVAGRHQAPFHAPPLNKTWWGICIPGYARQTRAEWLDPQSLAGIQAVAAFIYHRHLEDGFPLVRVSAAGLRAGEEGYCSHWDVSVAFGQTDHTDPGKDFPWDVLAAEIAKLATPVEPPTPPSIEQELHDMGSFTAIISAAGMQRAFVDHGAAGTAMTGLYDETDAALVRASFKAKTGQTIPEGAVSTAFYVDLQTKALKSMGFA